MGRTAGVYRDLRAESTTGHTGVSKGADMSPIFSFLMETIAWIFFEISQGEGESVGALMEVFAGGEETPRLFLVNFFLWE
jgi:hypothetical protein